MSVVILVLFLVLNAWSRENIHAETYDVLLQTFLPHDVSKIEILEAALQVSTVGLKNAWARRWMDVADRPFAERLVAFACVEGIFFSSSFAVIFWFKSKGKLPGLTFSNDLISRDEGLHTEFACLLLKHLPERPSQDVVHTIVGEAVKIETKFAKG